MKRGSLIVALSLCAAAPLMAQEGSHYHWRMQHPGTEFQYRDYWRGYAREYARSYGRDMRNHMRYYGRGMRMDSFDGMRGMRGMQGWRMQPYQRGFGRMDGGLMRYRMRPRQRNI